MEVIGFDSDKRLHTTSGFTQAGVYSRRQFGADIQVCSPQELLCNPRLREAANTLPAIAGRESHRKSPSGETIFEVSFFGKKLNVF